MTVRSLSRRDFLQTAAALAAAGGVLSAQSLPAAEESAVSKVGFGFSLYGMRSLPVAEGLKTCAEIGYDSVELVANKDWPCAPETLSKKDRREIRRQLQGLNLGLPALMENLHVVVEGREHRRNLDRLKAAGELGHDLSPDEHRPQGGPPVIETILGGRPQQWDEIKGRMAKGLQDWAKAAEKANTVIAVKAHVGGALHTPEGAAWLVNEVDSPWIRLAYDYSHFQLRNFDLEKSLQAMIARTVFIHVKDRAGELGKFRFLLPGDGDIDYVAYFKLLKQSGYTGDVVVEVSGQIHGKPDYDPVAAAKRSYANLAPAFREAGFRRT